MRTIIFILMLAGCADGTDTATDTDEVSWCGVDYEPCCDLEDPDQCQRGYDRGIGDCSRGAYNGSAYMFDYRTGYEWAWDDC